MSKTTKPQGIEVGFNVKTDVRLSLLDKDTNIPFGKATCLQTYVKGEERTVPGGGKDKRKQTGMKMDHEHGSPHYVGAASLARLQKNGKGTFFDKFTVDEATGEGKGILLPSIEYRVVAGEVEGAES